MLLRLFLYLNLKFIFQYIVNTWLLPSTFILYFFTEYVNFELLQQDHEYPKENRINVDLESSRNKNNSPILKIIVQSILSTSFVIDAFLETFLILI